MIFASNTDLKRGVKTKTKPRKKNIMDVTTGISDKITPKIYWYKPGIISQVCSDNKKWTYRRKGKRGYYISPYGCALDTEFYTLTDRDNNDHIKKANAYVYIWQLCIDDVVILCRYIDKFNNCVNEIIDFYKLGDNRIMYMLIANAGCEFQFIKHYVNIIDGFMIDKRTPLTFCINNTGLKVYDACKIANASLASIGNDYCTTQKLVGDIDYNLPRHSQTSLTDQEINYCVNDVIILSEYYQYLKRLYIDNQMDIPMTATGVIRLAVKQCYYSDKKNRQYPLKTQLTKEQYDFIRGECFLGGYTHSNCLKTGYIIHDVVGIDFTSSYPAVMLHDVYPMSKPKLYKGTFNQFLKFADNKSISWCAKIQYTNIVAITSHSIISADKTAEYKKSKNLHEYVKNYNVTYDNGRILKATQVTVCVTNVDYDIYNKFYKYDDITACNIYYMYNDKLPDYLLNPIKYFYKQKCKLKMSGQDDTPDYKRSKAIVNAGYGLTVQKFCEETITYNGDYDFVSNDFKNNILSPMWGVWITAYARRNLLQNVLAIGNDVIYCDTDSIYMTNYDKHKKKIDDWNNKIKSLNNIYDDCFADIGCFDIIKDKKTGKYIYDKFKTLGAKRYIKTVDNNTTVTIAGLPKNVLQNYCKNENIDIYEAFDDFMNIQFLYTDKNATKYNDGYHCDTYADYLGNVYTMQSKSSMGIYPVSFKMCINDLYKDLLNDCNKL